MRLWMILSALLLSLAACVPQNSAPQVTIPAVTSRPDPALPESVPTSAPVINPTMEASPTSTSGPGATPGWIAYTSIDGNIALFNTFERSHQQLTTDAVPLIGPETPTISYCCPEWSSDGKMLAFQREVGIPQEDGFKFEFSLLVYEAASGLVRQIVENKRVIGFSWEPGTYRIAYGVETTGDYFATRGSPSSEYAKGILSIDALSGNSEELVPPLQGYWIVNPHWSPTGRYLSFEEVLYMEGRGQFAYYDFSNREYVSWGRPVGYYDWSPDEHLIAYDTLTYNPDGTERIWISSIGGSDERPFSRENDQGYAFYPAFSPQGDYLAYFTGINGLESSQYTLIVQPVEAGEPRELGIFTQVTGFRWSSDGKYLALSAGPYEARQVFLVSMSDGNVEAIAPGYQPTWQP